MVRKEDLPAGWPSDFVQAFLEVEAAWWKGREDHYENADNVRVARVGVPEEIADYELHGRDGCCGEEAVTLDVTWDGNIVKVLYAFNYGH